MLITLFKQKRYAEMETLARAMTVRFPNHGPGWKAVGAALMQQGRNAETLVSLQKAAKLLQRDFEVHYNLGNILNDMGQPDEAEASYRRALEIKPDFADAHFCLGNILNNKGLLFDAIACYRRALEIKPDFAKAHYNLGNTLNDQGRFSEAITCYQRALKIKPDFAEVHYNLGVTLNDLGRQPEAEASFRRALEIKPDFAEAHNSLGALIQGQGQSVEAKASFRRALEIKPDFAEAHSNMGALLQEQGRPVEAEASYRRAMEIKPGALQYAVCAHLLLPVIYDTVDAINAWRARYQRGVASLMDMPGCLEIDNTVNPNSFYLAYHNHNDRTVMEALCHFFRTRVQALTYTAPHVSTWRSPATRGQRIRVGFLSEFLVEHTIGNLNQGLIRHLDRNRFEVVVIHSPKAKQDTFRKNLDTLADKTLSLPANLAAQQQTVAAEKLDVLFYPDIGMSPTTYFLAYARLAPVQAVTWGHPDTTGLDTMDYFVSVTSFEPEDAEEHYTERLIRLSRLNCFYQPPERLDQIPTRSTLGLPETGTLYGCPQTLFKLHPDFDAVLAAIADGDPTGHIVLLEGKDSALTALLKTRWKKNFPVLLDRVLFMPLMPRDRFIALQARMDVLLDPIHFGGGNTFYEAMIYGTPMVTWPGKFMRSRIVAGAYRQMNLLDAPIARRLEDYAPLALMLGRDPERRRMLRQASREAASQELFADMQAVREFEAFLEAAVEAAGREEKLPANWWPNIQIVQT